MNNKIRFEMAHCDIKLCKVASSKLKSEFFADDIMVKLAKQIDKLADDCFYRIEYLKNGGQRGAIE